MNPSPVTAMHTSESRHPGVGDYLAQTFLSKEQLRCILQIFINVSLVLLPLYASLKFRKDNERR